MAIGGYQFQCRQNVKFRNPLVYSLWSDIFPADSAVDAKTSCPFSQNECYGLNLVFVYIIIFEWKELKHN